MSVLIKPGAKHREEVIKNDDGSLTVYTKMPAVEGKANHSLIRLVANYFEVRKSQVQIVRGHSSKHKIVSIDQ